ncbi:hypothetical protein ACFY4C_35515 [Actinomadura viridis]
MREAAVVTIFEIRVGERLGYQAIADRLNFDLDPSPGGSLIGDPAPRR